MAGHAYFSGIIKQVQITQSVPSRAELKAVLSEILSESKGQVTLVGNPSQIDPKQSIREWALNHGLSPEQVLDLVETWVEEAEEKRDDPAELASAEFYRKNFTGASRLYAAAAEAKRRQLEELQRKSGEIFQRREKLTVEIIANLASAGDAQYISYRFAEALEFYEAAHAHTAPETDPQLWAETLLDMGRTAVELGIRMVGKASNDHLATAITAFRSALQVFTREGMTHAWAVTQTNLGNALSHQAERTVGPEGVELLVLQL